MNISKFHVFFCPKQYFHEISKGMSSQGLALTNPCLLQWFLRLGLTNPRILQAWPHKPLSFTVVLKAWPHKPLLVRGVPFVGKARKQILSLFAVNCRVCKNVGGSMLPFRCLLRDNKKTSLWFAAKLRHHFPSIIYHRSLCCAKFVVKSSNLSTIENSFPIFLLFVKICGKTPAPFSHRNNSPYSAYGGRRST